MEGAAAAGALASAVELRSRRKRHELKPLGQDSHLRAYGAHPGRVRAAAPPQGRVSSARCACARARRRRVRRIGAQGGASGVLWKPLSLHDEGVRRAAASPRVCRRDAARALAPIACASARPRAERPVPSANAPGGRGFGRDLTPLTLPQVVGMVVADERLVLGLSRTRTRSKSSADCEMVPSPSLLRTLCCSVWHKCDLKGRTLLVTDFAVLVSTFSSEKGCQTVSECSSSGMLCQIMTSCVLLTCQGSTQANNAAFFQSRV